MLWYCIECYGMIWYGVVWYCMVLYCIVLYCIVSSFRVPKISSPKCPLCDNNHWLSQCQQFRKMSLIERFKLMRRKGLCDNCLTRGHLARNCPKESFCKVQDCKEKHSTILICHTFPYYTKPYYKTSVEAT
jgi:hypothetical protein